MQYTLQLRGQIPGGGGGRYTPLFLLYPYMYSVEYSMSGTSEHNKAKSRNHIAYNFPMLLLFCIQLNREQLVVPSTENTYVHQAIFLIAEKAYSIHTGQ